MKKEIYFEVIEGEKTFTIPYNVIVDILVKIYKATEESDFSQAIVRLKNSDIDEEFKEEVYFISYLYKKELSGEIIPPVSMKKVYDKIAENVAYALDLV